MSPRRANVQTRRLLGASIILAALLGTAACSSEPSTNAPEGQTSSQGASAEDRQANWLVNPMYVCIQNKTEQPLSLVWSEYVKDTSGNQRDAEQLSKTLGPDAFDCAVSYSYRGNEHAEFKIEGTTLIASNSGAIWFIGNNLHSEYELLREGKVTTWPFTGSTDEQRSFEMRGVGTETLRTFNKVKAYSVDIQIVDAP